MVSKSIGVAYTPTSSEIPTLAPQKIETPSYPDEGVAYAGYSKTLMAGNQYKLNPQVKFDYNLHWTPGAGTTSGWSWLSNAQDKNHYISAIVITPWPNSVNSIEFREYQTGRRVYVQINDNFTIPVTAVNFTIPIKIKNGAIQFVLSAPAVASDEYAINIYGWYE